MSVRQKISPINFVIFLINKIMIIWIKINHKIFYLWYRNNYEIFWISKIYFILFPFFYGGLVQICQMFKRMTGTRSMTFHTTPMAF
jgi:hypothetical protein